MKPVRTFCLTALLALTMLSAPAAAERTITYGSLSQSQRIGVIADLVAAGDLEKAQLFLSNSRFDEDDNGYRAAFLQALVFKRTGRLAESEDLLRRILDERPAYMNVRLELAEVLASRGNRTAAAYHLQLLVDTAPDGDSRARFESFIDRISPSRPFTMGGFVTIAPSTNINNGASASTMTFGGLPFQIAKRGRATSGIGVKAGVNAAYTMRLTEKISAYAAGSAAIAEYEGGDFDTITGDARLGLRMSDVGRLIGAELIADRRWIAQNPTDYGTGARLYFRQALAPRWLLSGESLYMARHFDGDPGSRTITFATHARLAHSFTPARTAWIEAGYVDERMPARAHFTHHGGHVELGTAMQLPLRINASLSGRLGLRDYDSVFPGGNFARQDRFYEVKASFLKRDWTWAGFTPRLTLSYYRQKSNVALYDFDRYAADISFTKEF